MKRRILIDSNPHESRVALIEDGRLAEIYVEPKTDRSLVGSIFKGRVHRVLPGIQSAFVDIGFQRHAFLFVDEAVSLEEPRHDEAPPSSVHDSQIQDLVQVGEEPFVQVTKDALPNKGARITTGISLPGRYLVYLPFDSGCRVSRRIDDSAERERLAELVGGLLPGHGGVIVRTAARGHGADTLGPELERLAERWRRIAKRTEATKAPALVSQEPGLAEQVLRDRFDETIEEVLVNDPDTHAHLLERAREVDPGLASRLALYGGDGQLFEAHDLNRQIEHALDSRVRLESGGSLVIQPTEALVAIDVNTGRNVGRDNLDETVLRTNLEAAEEIARQIRLRDLSGIIVVDFIDMDDPDHREELFSVLEARLARDHAKTHLLRISDFGLVEITRRRGRSNLEASLTRPCPDCGGRGRVRSLAAVCARVRRGFLEKYRRDPETNWCARVHPEVATALRGPERAVLEELERVSGRPVTLLEDPEESRERFSFTLEVQAV